MAITSKTTAMKVLRVRYIQRLILFRAAQHNRRSVIPYKKLKGPLSSFNEPLLTDETSFNSWFNPHIEKVPKGCIPVYVGRDEKRIIIPMACLSMPEFDSLMERAAEEYGFEQEGALKIPCDDDDFEEILLKCLANHKATSKTRKKKWARR